MPPGTIADILIRLIDLKKKIPRGKSMVFGQKWPNFQVAIVHLFMSPGMSASRKAPLEINVKCK